MTDISKEAVERCYFVIKRGLYYGPNNRGYTDRPILAGLYAKAEAEEMTHPNGVSGPRDGMYYKHMDDVGDADWAMFRAQSARIEELEAQVAAARNEALREAAEMCRRTTMEVPMKHQRGKLGGLYVAGEAIGGGFHEGMGYADAILALMEEPTND